MALADLAVLHICVLTAAAIRLSLRDVFPIGISPQMLLQVLVAMTAIPVAYAVAGLYPAYGTTPVERLRTRTTIVVAGFAFLIAFDYLVQNGQWSRGLLLGTATLALVACPLGAAMTRALLTRLPAWGAPAILCGTPERRRSFAAALLRDRDLGWRAIAECDTIDAAARIGVENALLIVLEEGGSEATNEELEDLPFARIVIVPSFGGRQSLWVSVRDIGGTIALETPRNLLVGRNRAIKRCADIALTLFLAPFAAIIVTLAALSVRLVSPGPAFYLQTREGVDGRPFAMWKLRTMRQGADAELDNVLADTQAARDEWDRHMKLRDDPRIVPIVGWFLRRFSIDELPQLWNVLAGQMSLVGPRPLPAYHAERLRPEARRLRQRVRPGITGLWQVAGRSNSDIERQQYLDTYYVRNWSIWLDIHVLAETVRTVLLARGAW